MSDSTITFQGVTRRFGRQIALDDVSIEVPEGSVLGLVGRNGAGKTTALRLAMGLLHPDRGSLRVLGMDPVGRGRELRRRVSLISEESALFPSFRVREILRLGAGLHPTWDEGVARELIKSLDLDPEQRIRELSRGTRAKVALLMAVATRPEVLLLDDPTSGLDPLVRREVLESIVEGFPARGGAVVYASHLIHDLERIADRIAVLDEGRIVLEGTVEELHAGFIRASAVFEGAAPTRVEGLRVLESTTRGRTLTLVTDAAPAALEQTLRGLGAQRVETESLSLEDLLIALLREGKEVAA